MIRRPPRSTPLYSSAASDVYKRQDRLRGAVLLGVDRDHIRRALARHAPEVPVIVVDSTDTGAMDEVVRAARSLAQPGDTVLLAPGCASKDMYSGYAVSYTHLRAHETKAN